MKKNMLELKILREKKKILNGNSCMTGRWEGDWAEHGVKAITVYGARCESMDCRL